LKLVIVTCIHIACQKHDNVRVSTFSRSRRSRGFEIGDLIVVVAAARPPRVEAILITDST
jgi:hypothetical protein